MKYEFRSLKWLLAEIIVVVIGILLAFQIESWNEYRVERADEKAALNGIYEDIEADLVNLERVVERIELQVASLKEFLNSLEQGSFLSPQNLAQSYVDSLFSTLWEPRSATYIGLKNNARLNIIQDETLRREIIEYYESEQIRTQRSLDDVIYARDNMIDTFSVDLYRQALITPLAGTETVETRTRNSEIWHYAVKLPLADTPRNPLSYASANEFYFHLYRFRSYNDSTISLLKGLHEKLRAKYSP